MESNIIGIATGLMGVGSAVAASVFGCKAVWSAYGLVTGRAGETVKGLALSVAGLFVAGTASSIIAQVRGWGGF